jgi:hypothetical protein
MRPTGLDPVGHFMLQPFGWHHGPAFLDRLAMLRIGGKPMRNMLAFIGALVVAFAGLGWYLDWYNIKRDPAPLGHQNLNIDLNGEKIVDDVHKGVQKGEQELQHILDKEKSKTTTPSSPDAGK